MDKLTHDQLVQLSTALDMLIKSNLRAMNNAKNPQFEVLHRKLDAEYNELKAIVVKAYATKK